MTLPASSRLFLVASDGRQLVVVIRDVLTVRVLFAVRNARVKGDGGRYLHQGSVTIHIPRAVIDLREFREATRQGEQWHTTDDQSQDAQ